MRKFPLILSLLLLTVLLPVFLPAQSIPLREINFSDARISQAGPESFYIRNLGFQGERYAVSIGGDNSGAWTITDLYGESANITPTDLILDFATIRLEGESRLLIDGIFVDGAVYQGSIRINDNDRAQLADGFEPGSLEAVNPERLRELRQAILEVAAPEYEERIAALEGELAEARATLHQQEIIINELLEENDSLENVLQERQAEVDRLRARVGRLESRLAEAVAPAPENRAGDEVDTADEADAAEAADAGETADDAAAVNRLDLRRLEQDVRALREEADGVAAAMRDLQRENERLVRENAELRSALRELRETEATEEAVTAEPVRRMLTAQTLMQSYRDSLTRPVLRGFEGGSARLGNWAVRSDMAVQRSPEEYFSRYALPVNQMDAPTLFAFRGRSLETEAWTGFGLHLFASDVEKPNGYGHGESLLVWFTRDRESYGSDNTYLQIYRSSDDVSMKRVAGGVIPEPITSPLEVEVLYQPEIGDITVAVNGEVKLLYKGWFGIEDGVEIALRTKGRGRFEGLTVHTLPE